MKRSKTSPLLLVFLGIIILVVVIGLTLYFTGTFSNVSTNQVVTEFPKTYDLAYNLKFNYNDNWAVTDNGEEGVFVENAESVNLLFTMAQAPANQTIDQVLDAQLAKIQNNVQIEKSDITINNIVFKRIIFRSNDQTMFPSDGLETYATLLNSNVYFVVTLNYPFGGDISEAQKIINTIRY